MRLRRVIITMFLKNKTDISRLAAHTGTGWILVEVLCCAVIVCMLAACITESSSMMVRASASGMEQRIRTLDFRSIAGEAENTGSSGYLFRGSWQANTYMYGITRGIGRVEVLMSLSSDKAPEPIRWMSWDISGRAR